MERLLAAHPNDPLTHSDRGFAFLRRHDSTAAHECFLESLRLDPNLKEGHAGLEESGLPLPEILPARGPALSAGRNCLNCDMAEHQLENWQIVLIVMVVLSLLMVLVEDYF